MIFVRLIFKREQPTKEFKTRMLDQLIRFATPPSSGPLRTNTKAPRRRKATKKAAKPHRAR
jgi:hypothetical protein